MAIGLLNKQLTFMDPAAKKLDGAMLAGVGIAQAPTLGAGLMKAGSALTPQDSPMGRAMAMKNRLDSITSYKRPEGTAPSDPMAAMLKRRSQLMGG